jgi:hypothetical protein
MLFNGASILEVLPGQERQIKTKIQSLEPNYVLNASEEDLVGSLVDEFTLDVPVLDEAGIYVDYGEKQIDVSGDPMRFIYDRSEPFYLAGTRVTFVIPFTGDPGLFGVQPQSGTYSSGGSRAEVVKSEIAVVPLADTNS